jgi:Ni/Co efflux regulator RcnB
MTGECEGKKVFYTYWQAVRAAEGLNRHHEKAKANVYRCKSGHWHTGNTLHGNTRKRSYKRNKYV